MATCRRGVDWTGGRDKSRPMKAVTSYRTPNLEIQTHTQTNLSWAHGAGRHQEVVDEVLPDSGCSGRREGAEVDELTAKTEHGGVEDVIKLDYRSQVNLFTEFEIARDVEIENELRRTGAGVARQISRLADGRQAELIDNRNIARRTGGAPL